jgi:hypothetical protein
VTSAAGIHHPGHVAFAPPTLQTIPEAITENVAIARARTHSRIMAVVNADADGVRAGAITVAILHPSHTASGRPIGQVAGGFLAAFAVEATLQAA